MWVKNVHTKWWLVESSSITIVVAR